MSSNHVGLPRFSEPVKTCNCIPKHYCLRNKCTSFTEVVVKRLRSVDLIPEPKPRFRDIVEVRDFTQQVKEEDLGLPTPPTVGKEVSLDAPGGSLVAIKSKEDLELEEVIRAHIRSPTRVIVRRNPIKFKIPSDLAE